MPSKKYVPCNAPHPQNGGETIDLYCILAKGHTGDHYDGGVNVGVVWKNEESEKDA
jgi:hypothetical protein